MLRSLSTEAIHGGFMRFLLHTSKRRSGQDSKTVRGTTWSHRGVV
jgi:hypothetical protein